MTVLERLVAAVEPWSTAYSNSSVLPVALTFIHVAALMIGGGLALGADRIVLKTSGSADARVRGATADAVGDVHRIVVSALVCSLVSGVLQLAADLEALVGMRVFWLKMGLVSLLLLNGAVMLRDERALRRDPDQIAGFRALKIRAATSVVLWLGIVLAGVGLMQG